MKFQKIHKGYYQVKRLDNNICEIQKNDHNNEWILTAVRKNAYDQVIDCFPTKKEAVKAAYEVDQNWFKIDGY